MEANIRGGCVSDHVPIEQDISANICSYLFNPLTLLTCLGQPTTVFTTLFILLSIKHACEAKMPTSAFALAVASYLSLHPAFLLPPIGMLCYDRLCQQQATTSATPPDQNPDSKAAVDQRTLPPAIPFALLLTTIFLATFALLLGLSSLLLPSFQFIPSVYLTPLQLPDLTPNPGLWWYFFIEMFDAFRSFFLGVFWLHMLSYSVPLCLRLRKQPLAAVVLMLGVNAVFEPYANIGAVGTALSCLCLLGHVFERTLPSPLTTSSLTDKSILQCHQPTATPSQPSQASSTARSSAPPSITSGSTPARETQISFTPSRSSGIWRWSLS